MEVTKSRQTGLAKGLSKPQVGLVFSCFVLFLQLTELWNLGASHRAVQNKMFHLCMVFAAQWPDPEATEQGGVKPQSQTASLGLPQVPPPCM